MDKDRTPDEIIDALGGTSEVARLCQVSNAAVSQWRENGIPNSRIMFLRLARPDVFATLEGRAAPTRRATDPTPAPGHCGRQPASPHNILDTVPSNAVVSAIPPAKE
ncbi:hypothetical protein GJ700_12530 [Duganella sp. FT92W]|uniref:Helix-turn-helix domain-containing protein n=1 Tax=Pseudoduganella rivuli TaxID=2666085 RepID=A0A7X2IMF2_9BURK|nr:Cro/CI family transcriptional regulator [Pseudoduganella rivuli]MRV72536.1 hypothetical protein [Pseudoduganella rivuli]